MKRRNGTSLCAALVRTSTFMQCRTPFRVLPLREIAEVAKPIRVASNPQLPKYCEEEYNSQEEFQP